MQNVELKLSKKRVVFLCYSRYTIFVAYFLKRLFHERDYCILVISDVIKNENGIIQNIRQTGIWDEVVELKESGVDPCEVEKKVQKFIEEVTMDIFYLANVLRCASHFFIKHIGNDITVNMFDEGIISLDLISGYEFYKRRGLPNGWIEFDFDRIDNFYVLFPKITHKIGKAQIHMIHWEDVVKVDMYKCVNELNRLFNYSYVKIPKEIMFIDSDMAAQGSITQEYENHCIDNVMRFIDATNCVVKVKPSISRAMLEMKYGKYNVSILKGGQVPFEVIYLNCVLHGDVPRVIVSLPTTAIWNVNLINQKLQVNDTNIISLAKIMYEYFYYPGNGDEMLDKIFRYQQCFKEPYCVQLPNTWQEFYEYFSNKYMWLCSRDRNEVDEYDWILDEYKKVTLERELSNYDMRFIVLRKWLGLNLRGKRLEEFFLKQNIDKIILYGYGIFGKLFLTSMVESDLKIQYILKTVVSDGEKKYNSISVLSIDEYANIKDTSIPMLITAVGKEKEVMNIIREKGIENPLYTFKDMVSFWDN